MCLGLADCFTIQPDATSAASTIAAQKQQIDGQAEQIQSLQARLARLEKRLSSTAARADR